MVVLGKEGDCQCSYVFGVTNEATAAASSKSEGDRVLCYPAPSDITALSPSAGKKAEVSVMNLLDHSLN